MPETVRDLQAEIWRLKVVKGFNTDDVPLNFMFLVKELAEAFDAWRKDDRNLADELADTGLFLLGLAAMVGVDLQDAINAKLAVIAAREYRALPNGTLIKTGEG
jgi:NTP pyrophosphatase (non-canonical NTP hydrolase)